MYVTTRENEILHFLCHHTDYLTVQELADHLKISSRTVHRELKKVESTLSAYELSIEKKAGLGIKLSGQSLEKQRLLSDLSKVEKVDFQQEERINFLICELIKSNEPIKLFTLASLFNVSIATLSHDLDKVEEKIKPFELTITRKRGFGIELTGEELSKRKILESLVMENLSEQDFLQIIEKNMKHYHTDEKLLGIVNMERLNTIDGAIKQSLNSLPYTLADSAYFALLVHLGLTIERILLKEDITFDENHLKQLQETEEYKIALQISMQLEKLFPLKVPVAEVGHITMHLRGARRQKEEEVFDQIYSKLSQKVIKLIEYVETKIQVSFKNDPSLYKGLIAHLEPACHRIQGGISTFNPLKEDIKRDYPDLFEAVKKALEIVFPYLVFSDGEIGFVVLHFGSALQVRNKKRPIHALVVCSSGIGSSKMLASRIHKEIPEITKTKLSSLMDLEKEELASFDLVISTIGLSLTDIPYIQVSPLLPDSDAEKIRESIKDIFPVQGNNDLKHPNYFEALEEADLLGKIDEFFIYGQLIKGIMERFRVYDFENKKDHVETLHAATEVLEKQKLIQSSEALTEELLKREKLGGLGIPHTAMALYHCRHDSVKDPTFVIFQLKHPYIVGDMGQGEIRMRTLLLLLAPKDVHPLGLKLLSLISSTLIEDEESLQVFQSGNGTWMVKKLNEMFYRWINEQIKK
ncbi:BglG family transcription antiterminator [Metabacillus arenae]|uniref:BglG family transcription antiterminator n=1 Tax=Metabacillus arenae TaxID=2771434 RepID=A0A926NGI3_9BACI|nr:BglG family transcription antiterminator [Metabacillus arenae]MBD1383024.1 BglG family transcription antiterminator [Metabacillus arenae]